MRAPFAGEWRPTETTDALITFINSQNLTWKADTCKLRPEHPDFACPQKGVDPISLAKVSDEQRQASLERVQSWRKNFSSAAEITQDSMSESYDLRDVDGVDYMGRQIAQGSCFSCYTLAFTYVVENRLKLKDALDGSISA